MEKTKVSILEELNFLNKKVEKLKKTKKQDAKGNSLRLLYEKKIKDLETFLNMNVFRPEMTLERLIKIMYIKSLLVDNGGTFSYHYISRIGWAHLKTIFTLKIDSITQNLVMVELGIGKDEPKLFPNEFFPNDYLDKIIRELKKEIYENDKSYQNYLKKLENKDK